MDQLAKKHPIHQVSGVVGGRDISIEAGRLARQANGSVLLRSGDTVLLATATMSKKPKDGVDFLPLTVEFVEKYYASGRFAGGYIKREARPSKHATLLSRLIDRPLRPLFPKGFHHDVQVIVTLLSLDDSFSLDHLAITAASSALMVSDIPIISPVGAVLVGDIGDQLTVNPTFCDMEQSALDMVVAGTKDAVLMIESSAHELSESRIIDAIGLGHDALNASIALQEELAQAVNKPTYTQPVVEQDVSLDASIRSFFSDRMQTPLIGDKNDIEDRLSEALADALDQFGSDDDEARNKAVQRVFESVKKEYIRRAIIDQKVRPDGRKTDEIRDISVEVDMLPVVHGSSLFTRGETQSLAVVTLGSDGDEQCSDVLGLQTAESFYFHYNFPPFSVGECGFLRTGRRELGHGQLAQRSLEAVLPDRETFPYVIRLVSEILESNGSSSMASVCSGSLALMSSGVPLTSQVAGIAMGLLMDESGNYTILSDIQGLEDHYGDMDFKVAGTSRGITALQLDIKVEGLSRSILTDALRQAREGLNHILSAMNAVISEPRHAVTDRAPKLEKISINPSKVGLLIGPGGKQIRKIEEDTGAKVHVADGDKGDVTISGPTGAVVDSARNMILGLVRDIEKGDSYKGKVVKIVPFGAFIELSPGKEGLLHISKIAKEHVEKVEDYLNVGDALDVSVIEVDQKGRVKLERV